MDDWLSRDLPGFLADYLDQLDSESGANLELNEV
jgi:hypothetical protein